MTKKLIKPQGKISEDVIIRELTKEKPDKLYNIAIKAGSIAKSRDNQSKAVIDKVKSSQKIQLALARHREATLNTQTKVQEKLYNRLLEEDLDKKLSADQVFNHLNKAGNLLQNLTKQDQNAQNNDKTPVQINILVANDKKLDLNNGLDKPNS